MENSLKPVMRTWATVDLTAIENNYKAVQRYTEHSCKILCVVKADAYGHGALQVAGRLEALRADYLGVSSLDEAMQLREGGITMPILILGHTPPEFCDVLLDNHLTQTVYDLATAESLSCIASRQGKRLTVHIKLDTGMGRLGLSAKELATPGVIADICALPGLVTEGIFTHFAAADERDNPFTREQLALFRDTVREAELLGAQIPIKHCANSGATVNFKEAWLDMVRVGILLYGMTTREDMKERISLTPAMQLNASISQVRKIKKGASVSYNRTYYAEKERTIAVIPIGYADGLSHALGNRGVFTLSGTDCPIVGSVCMDMCIIDVSDVPDAKAGDTVVIYGAGGHPIEEIAYLSNTINYEVTCLIGKRVLRIYYSEGKDIGFLNYIRPYISSAQPILPPPN